jgi:hypothetical protein
MTFNNKHDLIIEALINIGYLLKPYLDLGVLALEGLGLGLLVLEALVFGLLALERFRFTPDILVCLPTTGFDFFFAGVLTGLMAVGIMTAGFLRSTRTG